MAFRLRISGDNACFPRPDFSRARISYDVITPLAARRILEAIYWRREIRWHIDAIRVLSPICFARASANGTEPCEDWEKFVLCDGDEGQGRLVLVNPAYVVDAHFETTTPTANPAQHTKMFLRAVRQARYFRPPYLGMPDYPARIELAGSDAPYIGSPTENADRDLGWTVFDVDDRGTLQFFRPWLREGVIQIAERSPSVS